MKFIFRYGLFLLNLINNDYDASEMFKKLNIIHEGRSSKKMASGSNSDNSENMFGENSACAIVMMSASSMQIGKIVHANEEI